MERFSIMIKISVIIPVYNVAEHLRKCLDSCLNQTLKEIEFICVNDGSTDNSLDILNEYALRDSRVIVVTQENLKQGAARNTGIKLAKGEYIGFVDSDDYIDYDYFDKLYSAAKKFDADIAVASIIKHRKNYCKYNVKYNSEKVAEELQKKIKLCEDRKHRFFYAWNKIYRKELIIENDIKFPEGRIYEDVIFAMKAIYYANKVVSVPETKYHYIMHSNSTLRKSDGDGEKKKAHILARTELIDFAKEHNVKLPERLNYIDSYWKTPFFKIYTGSYKMKVVFLGLFPVYVKYL